MGALPKRKVSTVRRGNRRSHHALKKINLVPCPNCHKLRLPHHICPHCGHYRGVEVIEVAKEK
ncbi:MAG: 50S ribosomal protein L32 [Anaerolineae bacterium]|nr:50S ribosomal protein L32 [Anaerolineae bacterium]